MKGIILSGGLGTRMYPVTKAISKQLLPVYDKPMIFYPLSVLLLASVRDVLIISTPESLPLYRELLGDGSRLGISISYAVQESPKGIAHSIIVAEEFIGDDSFCLILGDNIFYGQDLTAKLSEAAALLESGEKEAVIFGYMVKNPSDFGVIEFDREGRVISIEEKPSSPKSNFVVPGLYFYSNSAVDFAKKLAPSKRGELEITALNNVYIGRRSLHCMEFGRGFAWLDTGTPERLLRAAEFIETVQNNQGFYVSCI
ncbi:MAG: glucose-1-phosphate thymidylyltransferase RfbA, partial [Clostridia bacterium]|nr:glucose-1-phosphate thymidylyltransferase RfbA [Clostridia bacterium]